MHLSSPVHCNESDYQKHHVDLNGLKLEIDEGDPENFSNITITGWTEHPQRLLFKVEDTDDGHLALPASSDQSLVLDVKGIVEPGAPIRYWYADTDLVVGEGPWTLDIEVDRVEKEKPKQKVGKWQFVKSKTDDDTEKPA